MLLVAALAGCNEGEVLAPGDGDGTASAALLLDDGNHVPRVLVGHRAIPIPLEVLAALPARPGTATRIRLAVDAAGRLTSATVVESGGDPVVDERALEAVRMRRFEAGYPREFVTSVWLPPTNR